MENHTTQEGNFSSKPDCYRRFDQLAEKINTVESHEALAKLLRNQLLTVYDVDMASIFLIDSLKMQLVSWLAIPGDSFRKIRIPINKISIAGYTASTRQMVLIQDPYDDKELHRIDPELKFDSSWDRQAGINTRQVLAMPIMVKHSLLGVIQLMNKRHDIDFSGDDKRLIKNLAKTLGNTLIKLQSA